MSNVRRVYVEKKPDFAVKAKELREEIKNYLGIKTVTNVRVLIRYDIENISEETYKKALMTVFSEPPVDDIYEETFVSEDAYVFSVEYLPGQFDQRADSAEQCVKLLNETEEPIIRSRFLTGASCPSMSAATSPSWISRKNTESLKTRSSPILRTTRSATLSSAPPVKTSRIWPRS